MALPYEELRNNYGEDQTALNISIQNNATISRNVWYMMINRRELIKTFRDLGKDLPSNMPIDSSQNQNKLYDELWFSFGLVVDMTAPHLLQASSKPSTTERELIKKCLQILRKTMRETNLKELCTLSMEYYDLLSRKGYFEITARYMQSSGIHGLMKG